jgi:capsular exopolysaccharide synthesis family protein
LEPHDALRYLRVAWPITAVLLVLGLVGGGAIAFLTPPRYEATAHDYVGTTSTSNVTDLVTGVSVTQQIVQSYATVATDPLVLQPVIDRLKLKRTAAQLAADVTVTNEPGTVVLDVTATASSARAAADIANAVSAGLLSAVDTLTPPKGTTQSPIKVTQTLVAQPPPKPTSPQPPLDIALGAVVGIALGLLLGLLRFVLDKRIRTVADIARATDVPVLASIPRVRGKRFGLGADREAVTEAYRLLRTNLQFLDISRGSRTILITSSVPAEGKTTTAGNLAVAISEAERSVVLVDADLRRPAVHTLFEIDNGVGLTDVLIGKASLDEAMQTWGGGKLMILPSGRTPPNPSELLQSKEMVDLLAALRKRFGTVVVDGAPLNPVADSVVLGARTSGALVVVGPSTTLPQLQRALLRLGNVNGRVLGLVTNLRSRRGTDLAGRRSAYYEAEQGIARKARVRRGRPTAAPEG